MINTMNEVDCTAVLAAPESPCTSLCNKVEKLHEMISDAEGIARGTREILFGVEINSQGKASDISVTCMDEDLDVMLNQMKHTLEYLREIRNRIG